MLLPWIQAKGIPVYQELLAGILSLFGAAAAVAVVIRQIRHAQEMEDERRERRVYAARAALTHAAAALSDYVDNSLEVIKNALGNTEPAADAIISVVNLRMPIAPETAIATLKELLEHGNKEVQAGAARLVSFLQVQRFQASRIEKGNTTYGREYRFILADFIELQIRAMELLGYARHELPSLGEPDRWMFSAMALDLGFTPKEWPLLFGALEVQRRPQINRIET